MDGTLIGSSGTVLPEVGFPVAMGNAAEAVQAVARLRVGYVDHGGLVQALTIALPD